MPQASIKNKREFTSAPRIGSARLVCLPLILGLAIAIGMLELVRSRVLIKLEEAALGAETQNVYTDTSGTRVLCQDGRDDGDCYSAYVAAGRPPAILWLGNSQLAAINRYKPGDSTAATLLHDTLGPRGYYVVSYAQPNANLHEHAVTFAALERKYDLKLLILPVFLDDIREQGIRPGIRQLAATPSLRTALEASPVWPHVSSAFPGDPAAGGEAADDNSKTLQKRIEDDLNGWLDSWWPLWRRRANLRGVLGYVMHTTRNKLLGINAQSKRKVDPAIYRAKMAVLDSLLAHARARGIKVLLCVPPYRQDIPGPYVTADYEKLKADLARKARGNGAAFANLEAIVPGPEWGKVIDRILGFEDYDFMHFTGEGHRRHAAALDGVLRGLGY